MAKAEARHRVLGWGERGIPPHGEVSRRRFLASLGLIAGAGAAAPLLARLGTRADASVEVSRAGLGTWIRIVARHPDRERAAQAIESAYRAIDRVDAQMSVHRADSELARVNRGAGEATAAVSPDLIEVVARARAAAERSDGIYDPTVLPLMKAYGFYRAADAPVARYPDDRAVDAALDVMSWRRIAADPAAGRLGLERRGAGLDLGSIGKGWAVDRAAAALRAAGVKSGLVDIGGNVFGLGTPDPLADGWSVGVLHPVTRQVDRVFVLRDQAVATSGNYEQYRILSGIRVGHLFDARRGCPADGHLSASVQARSGVESDVMSTAAFLLGPDAFRAWPGAERVHFIG
jgi:thiamine biosynthesis lipoprotein